jgi:hypothetical protein
MTVPVTLALLSSSVLMTLAASTTMASSETRSRVVQTTREWGTLQPEGNVRFGNGSMVIADPGTIEFKSVEIFSETVPENQVSVPLPETLEAIGPFFRLGVRSETFDVYSRTFKVTLPTLPSENPELLNVSFLDPSQLWHGGVPGSMARRFGKPYANAETLYGSGTLFVLTRNKNLPRRPIINVLPGQIPNENREIGVLRPESGHLFDNGAKVYAPLGAFTGRPLVVYSQIIQTRDVSVPLEDVETVGDYFRIGAYDDDIGADKAMFQFSIPFPKGERVSAVAILSVDYVYNRESPSSWSISLPKGNRLLDDRLYVGYNGMERKGAVFVLIRWKSLLSTKIALQCSSFKDMPFCSYSSPLAARR